ncbi:hypothetical protein ACQ86N_21920 [Puia sp. P3]|uniref:hypothetical protein n=1 Tax=Puia sp. P3 TaxID=3423952 RepID=UPI003D670986
MGMGRIELQKHSSFLLCGQDEKLLQLEERGIIAGNLPVFDLSEMARITYQWLDAGVEIFELANELANLKIADQYRNLKTLSNAEILSLRSEKLLAGIKKGSYCFRVDVFEACKDNFSSLFPTFSHDHLTFSDVFYSIGTFKSPFIYCDKDIIEVGCDRSNSINKNNIRTSSLRDAVEFVKRLLPEKIAQVTNP